MAAKKNFAKGTVSTGYDAAATSVVLTTGHSARFPTVPFNAVWWNSTDYPDPSDDPNKEVVTVTAIATETWTITRGVEGTSASTKNTASKTYLIVAGATAADFPITTRGDIITGDSNGNAQRVALGDTGGIVGSNGTDTVSLDPRKYIRIVDDFFSSPTSAVAGDTNWVIAVGSSGALTTSNAQSHSTNPGQVRLATSTTSGSYCSIRKAGSAANDPVLNFGNGKLTAEWVIYIPTLGDASNDITLRIGFSSSVNADPADGVFFRYRHSENSGNWVGVCRQSSTESVVNGSTAVGAAAWTRLTITVNAAGNSADFAVNGTSIGTVTTNIPTGSRYTAPLATIVANAALVAARTIHIDLWTLLVELTTKR